MPKQVSRRQYLLAGGAATATALGSIAFTPSKSKATTASVSGTYAIPDDKVILADQSLENIILTADVNWEFQSNADIHQVECELHVGATPSTMDLIARQEKTDLAKQSLTGNPTLRGSILNASDFSVENFQPSDGELTVGVVSGLRFYALRNGEVVADAEQVTSFDITVSEEALEVSTSLSGSGEVSFNTTA